MRRLREREDATKEKILDVDATMQGTLTFRDPVNLKINGRFEGKLITKGTLVIGEHAVVTADIYGESISIAGKVSGDIVATKDLKLTASAQIAGNITTPVFSIDSGAIFDGNCRMGSAGKETGSDVIFMSTQEVAKYLEVEPSVVVEWASSGKIPAIREADSWKIDRRKLDEWIASGKIR